MLKQTFFLDFFVSPQIVRNVVTLTHFYQDVPQIEKTLEYLNAYAFLWFFCLYKGQVSYDI